MGCTAILNFDWVNRLRLDLINRNIEESRSKFIGYVSLLRFNVDLSIFFFQLFQSRWIVSFNLIHSSAPSEFYCTVKVWSHSCQQQPENCLLRPLGTDRINPMDGRGDVFHVEFTTWPPQSPWKSEFQCYPYSFF